MRSFALYYPFRFFFWIGLGSTVVSGEVTPDRWVVAKLTGEIPVRDISDKHVRDCPAPVVIADGGHFLQEWGDEVMNAWSRTTT